MAFLFSGCGSQSSDFSETADIKSTNPLPPCPDSPNCVRITKHYPESSDLVWEASLSALRQMKPYDIEISADEYRVDAVFPVVFFRDDMAFQLEPSGSGTSVHIRSASRIGYSDLGVNRRRVRRFSPAEAVS